MCCLLPLALGLGQGNYFVQWRCTLLHPVQAQTAHFLWGLQERKAAVIRAEGESEAAKLISEATKTAGPGMIELRRIEAARDIAGTLSKSRNVVYLPSGGNMLLGINPTGPGQ